MVADPTGTWSPLSPTEVVGLLAHADFDWWIGGGYAIELFVGENVREHGDIDVVIFRDHAERARAYLTARDWDVHLADRGTLARWSQPLPGRVHNIWCRLVGGPWALQVMVAERRDGRWLYRRDPLIGGPLAEFGLSSSDGVPILAPEIQLLYKSKSPRTKDEIDFDVAAPRLSDAKRRWLARALDEDHPWQSRLSESPL